MFEKMKLRKELEEKKKLIADLEQRRMRSQGAILEAILAHQIPSDEDTDYFNDYTAKIDEVRNDIHELMKKLGMEQ